MRYDLENFYKKQVKNPKRMSQRDKSMTCSGDFSAPEQEQEVKGPRWYGPRKEPSPAKKEVEQRLREHEQEQGLPRWYGPREGEVEKEDRPLDQPHAREVLASPIIRNLARELGIDLREVKGSGKEGRILRKDLEAIRPEARTWRQRRRTGGQAF